MTDIAVIILVGQEKIHMQRCMEKLAALEPRQIFVVESQADDGGHQLALDAAAKLGWRVQENDQPSAVHLQPSPTLSLIFHTWPGTQTRQFNWALDNLSIEAEWILRLDADEYLTDDSVAWVNEKFSVHSPIPTLDSNSDIPSDVDALAFTLERKFMGGMIRHATNGIKMVRMFRRGRGRYPEMRMDERIVFDGKKLETPVVFIDDNLNDLAWWKAKHRGYAKREAEQAIESLKTGIWTDSRKAMYYKQPRYLRVVLYFCIRYFLKLGFFDGRAGFLWNFWQGLWYRLLVDREIGKMQN